MAKVEITESFDSFQVDKTSIITNKAFMDIIHNYHTITIEDKIAIQ